MKYYNLLTFNQTIKSKTFYLFITTLLFLTTFAVSIFSVPVSAAVSDTTEAQDIFDIPNDAIAQGTANNRTDSSKWYLSDNVLHIGPGVIQLYDQINNWDKYSNQITSISLDGKISLMDPSSLEENTNLIFSHLPQLTKIVNIDKLDVSKVTNISELFENDPKLTTLNLSNWDTSNISIMDDVFNGDSSLSSVNLSNWNTKKVYDFTDMFEDDSSLTSLDLSSFDTSNVQTFTKMFDGDSNLTNLNISSFDTHSAIFMDYMFFGLSKIKSIKFPKTFDTSNVHYMYFMFSGDSSLQSIDISNFDTVNALSNENVDGLPIFDGDDSLESIKLGPKNKLAKNFSISNAKSSTWVNIGNGTIKKPQANLSFHTDENGSDAYKIYDGTAKTVETFVPKLTNVTSDVTIHSNLEDQVVNKISGVVGKTVVVTVPQIKGYTADKKQITANVYNDGTIITDEKVTYTPISTPHHSTSSSSNHQNNNQNGFDPITKQTNNIATYSDKGDTPIYSYNGSSMKIITNKKLAPNSDWFTDEKATIKDKSYYRVATNEWVETSRAYPYQTDKQIIKTHSDSIKYLTKAEGIPISNRALAPNTSWKIDRDITLNGKKYYRVATNEFVKASDVDINH